MCAAFFSGGGIVTAAATARMDSLSRNCMQRVPPGVGCVHSVSVTRESVAKRTSTADQQLFAPGSHQSVRAFKLGHCSVKSGCSIASTLQSLATPNARPSKVQSDAYGDAQTTRTVPDNRSDRRRLPQQACQPAEATERATRAAPDQPCDSGPCPTSPKSTKPCARSRRQ